MGTKNQRRKYFEPEKTEGKQRLKAKKSGKNTLYRRKQREQRGKDDRMGGIGAKTYNPKFRI
jgi:hypothetical protein